MEETFDFGIVGAGIVGLAVGREILKRLPDARLLILEKESSVGLHQTGHNSGVIHSGIYYKPGSLKARLCVAGAAEMLDFVQSHGIPYERCGKVIIAVKSAEIPALKELRRRGEANGVPGLRWLQDAAAIRAIEPHAAGLCGIHVPSTAITDYKLVAKRYAELIAESGGTLRLSAGVNNITRKGDETVLATEAGDFRVRYLINCAGLYSDRIARMAGTKLDTAIFPFRGEYYDVLPQKQHLVRGLIYPVPDPNFPFLGVHFTRRVGGGIEAGPNAVLAWKREGYKKSSFSLKDSAAILSSGGFWKMGSRYWRAGAGELYRSWSKSAFTRSLRELLPELQEEDLHSGGSGVRAQAVDRAGKLIDDFRFVHSDGVTHVCNVPSPAATASLQIAGVVVDVLLKQFTPGGISRPVAETGKC
jgi:(S)-2-hydroxyglutarate dehydrogenase